MLCANIREDFGIRKNARHLDRVVKKCYNDNEDTAFLYLYNGLGALASVTDTATQEKISYVYDTVGSRSETRTENGDIIAILNTSGEVVVTYEDDPWGKILSTSGSMSATLGADNPFRYRGYYYDNESGFYYLQSRYYDPVTGRFLNADTVSGANKNVSLFNQYSYCGNDPVNSVDRDGFFFKRIWNSFKETVRKTIRKVHSFFRQRIDTAHFGSIFLQMRADNDGVYHADFNCWQQYFGYNDFYDFMFDLGTYMVPKKLFFSSSGMDYVLWMWKGDYINLGAGAEIGIYQG